MDSATKNMTTEIIDKVLVVSLDLEGEKVNKLCSSLSLEFETALKIAEQDTVEAIVIISGKKDNFIAGADIDELSNAQSGDEIQKLSQNGQILLDRLESSAKPVIAAIHGACMGGGLELALACHYRIATQHSKTVMALPEVMLGLLPGAGGTQRLPRQIGIQAALDMMLTGRNIRPAKAKKLGLVDVVVSPGGLKHVAIQAAQKLVRGDLKPRKREPTAQQKALEETPPGRALLFRQAKSMVLKQTKGLYPAPLAILEVVEHGFSRGMRAGLNLESERFATLSQTPECKGLMSLFFGQQKCKKNRFGTPDTPVETLGVLGAGLMGAGIALVSVQKDDKVLLKDISHENVSRGKKQIYSVLHKKAKRKALTGFERDRLMSQVNGQIDYAGFESVDLVIEAVFEDLSLKHRVIKEVEEHISDDCVFATNTSALPITEIAKGSARPENVVGMHYFSPVEKMPLLEIIVTEKTSDHAAAVAVEYGLKQGKTVIVVKDGPGFYTTRILAPFMDESAILLAEGVSPYDLDDMLKKIGFPVGPVTLLDEVGLDVGAHVSEDLKKAFGERLTAADPRAIKALLETGAFGRKTGRGFYIYDAHKSKGMSFDKLKNTLGKPFGVKSRKPVNPDALKVVKEYRIAGNHNHSLERVQNRMILRFVNEAVLCLQEGILDNPVDGDIGAVFGLGFPPMRGGPFRYVDAIGVSEVVRRLKELENEFGIRFTPAQMLVDMAKAGKTFHTS
jgi:enoyl-CoA hydratase/long-chain 3-hydroxyacyl-CoA dehydrogenase